MDSEILQLDTGLGITTIAPRFGTTSEIGIPVSSIFLSKILICKYETAKSTGQRRHIIQALIAARRLEDRVEQRYDGTLWHQETITGRIDPRFRRSEDNVAAVEALKNSIADCISDMRKEFAPGPKAATDKDDSISSERDNEKKQEEAI